MEQNVNPHKNDQANVKGNVSRSFWIKLTLVPVLMFGFAFALVPLYDVFCDVTGLNGRIENTAYQGTTGSTIDENHKISVDFLSATMPGLPVNFYPKQKQIDIVPGKIYTIHYIAENRSDETVVGQAVPSVSPTSASIHFKKLECFCFTNQTFEPKKPVEMSVKFFVDSKLAQNVQNITLSYNFFKVKESKGKELSKTTSNNTQSKKAFQEKTIKNNI